MNRTEQSIQPDRTSASQAQRYAHALLVHVSRSKAPDLRVQEAAPLPALRGISSEQMPAFAELARYLDRLFDSPESPHDGRRSVTFTEKGDKPFRVHAYFDLQADIQNIRLVAEGAPPNAYHSDEYLDHMRSDPIMLQLASVPGNADLRISATQMRTRAKRAGRAIRVRTVPLELAVLFAVIALFFVGASAAFENIHSNLHVAICSITTSLVMCICGYTGYLVTRRIERRLARHHELTCPYCDKPLWRLWREVDLYERGRWPAPASPDRDNPFWGGFCDRCYAEILILDEHD